MSDSKHKKRHHMEDGGGRHQDEDDDFNWRQAIKQLPDESESESETTAGKERDNAKTNNHG